MPNRLATPDKIRTLQRKLYTKAKREPGFRFCALYDKVYRADILDHAYALVRANRGAPGIDGVSCASIEAGEGRSAWLTALAEQLAQRTYRADPVRRVQIPKADGGQRSLGIPTLTACISCPRRRAGAPRMPWCEAHWKAVYGRTVRTV